ncbi:CopD family protein [Algoriphagus terrigena]|uniref:CopD family protein n=1 Tax=Algoriphagus terrigena TaxID=344884 RepID=UPI0012F9A4D9|nr:hypothetical protein [Algoriphagus terrigena]
MREIMLILHFIGLTMGLGTSFAHGFLSQAVSKMEPAEAVKFRLHSMVLSRMGHIGLALLVVSGVYLIIPFWQTLPSNPLLMLKLALVFVLAVLIFLIGRGTRQAIQGDAERHLKKIEPLGKLTLLVGIAIVTLAVYVFH